MQIPETTRLKRQRRPSASRWPAAAAVGLALAAAAHAAPADRIEQHGFAWTFAEPVEHGRFATGDYWVIGPVRVVRIEPASEEREGRTRNGSMINPRLGGTQGYDSHMYGSYRSANSYAAQLNVGLGVSAENPLLLPPGTSLISSRSVEAPDARPQLRAAAVLTVLAEPPAPGSFRPPYFGDDKTVRYREAQLDYGKLPRLPPPPGAPALRRVAARFERPWFDHILSWTGRYAHPAENMPDYGRDIALAIGDAALLLMLDLPDAEKRDLLVPLVQFGIDLHAILAAGGVWEDLGGHMHGRKLPILLAGLVLGDPDLRAIGRTHPQAFQEDRQTFLVTEGDVGRRLHTADRRPREPYRAEHVGLAEWGEQHTRQRERDGSNWNAYYRRNVGHSILAHALVADMLGLREDWNHPPLFGYLDRYWELEKDRTGAGVDNIPAFHRSMKVLWETRSRAPTP